MLYGEFDVDFYEWFFSTYACPRMREEDLDESYHVEKQRWMDLAKELPREVQEAAEELLFRAKYDWGQCAFTLGVQAGILLIADLPRGPTM